MAKNAGLTVAKHHLLNAKSERPILLVERFDRVESGRITAVLLPRYCNTIYALLIN